jgi:hypothetical protein
MGDDHDGDAELRPDPGQQADDPPLVPDVERRQRLVEDEQPGPADERLGDGDALALSTAAGMRTP